MGSTSTINNKPVTTGSKLIWQMPASEISKQCNPQNYNMIKCYDNFLHIFLCYLFFTNLSAGVDNVENVLNKYSGNNTPRADGKSKSLYAYLNVVNCELHISEFFSNLQKPATYNILPYLIMCVNPLFHTVKICCSPLMTLQMKII